MVKSAIRTEIFSAFKSVIPPTLFASRFYSRENDAGSCNDFGIVIGHSKPTAQPMKDVYSAYDFVAMTHASSP